MTGQNFLKASNKKSFSKVKRTSNLFDSFVVKWKKNTTLSEQVQNKISKS